MSFSHFSATTFFKNANTALNASGGFISGIAQPVKSVTGVDIGTPIKQVSTVVGGISSVLGDPEPTGKEFGETLPDTTFFGIPLPPTKIDLIAELGSTDITSEQVERVENIGSGITTVVEAVGEEVLDTVVDFVTGFGGGFGIF